MDRPRNTRARFIAIVLLLAAAAGAVAYVRSSNRSANAASRSLLQRRAAEVGGRACPGVRVTAAAEPGRLDLELGEAKGTWSIDNLAREVATEHLDDREIDRRLMQTATSLCSGLRASVDVPKTWDLARPLLRPQLVPTAYAEENRLVSRPFAPGIAAACVLDYPEHVLYMMPERLAAWGVDEPAVFAAAVENLTRAVGATTRVDAKPPADPTKHGKFAAFEDGDGYSAARILVPSIRKEIAVALGDPFYFAVPNRGFLVAWSQDYAYTDQFMGKVREDFARRPYPISQDVFLVHGDVGTAPSRAADAGSDDRAEGGDSIPSSGRAPGVVLFGSDLERRIDTWMFSGASWTKLDLPVHPPSRWASSMATLGSEIILFGGDASGVQARPLRDTWIFDGARWAEVPVDTAPPARSFAIMATLGEEIVLFGGESTREFFQDTWMFNGARWRKLSVDSPPPKRIRAAAASLGNEIVLFGGATDSVGGSKRDTWTFDGASWTQVVVANPPPARAGASMASLRHKVVLFGGSAEGQSVPFGDTWTFDGTSWARVDVSEAPPAREGAVMAALGGEIVLFGGRDTVDDARTTWTFDGTRWSRHAFSSTPPVFEGSSMAALPPGR
jgi:N-acetylneuraminic acid mutarotase